MALRKEVGLDTTLGARKDALLADTPNTRKQQEITQQVVWEHAAGRPDYVDLMCAIFAPLRPIVPLGASNGERHPTDCGCGPCRIRRGKRAAKAKNTTTKGETR